MNEKEGSMKNLHQINKKRKTLIDYKDFSLKDFNRQMDELRKAIREMETWTIPQTSIFYEHPNEKSARNR